MPRFAAVVKETGVDQMGRFMAVGCGNSNVVILHDAKGLDLQYDHRRLDVQEMKRDKLHQVSNALNAQLSAWNLTGDDAKNYRGAVHNAVNFSGSRSRLFFVTGKMCGSTDIKVFSGRAPVTLEVAVLAPLSFTVAFKFLPPADPPAKFVSPYNPSYGRDLLQKLNGIYGPQANVTFELLGSDWVTGKVMGDTLNSEAFLSSFVGQKNAKAKLNVFFVGRWKGGEAGGTYFEAEKTAAVSGAPDPADKLTLTPDADPFLVVFAHEVAHFLEVEQIGKAPHLDTTNVLLSNTIQSTRIERDLVQLINPA